MAIKNGLLKVLVEEGLLTQEQAEAVVVEASQKGLSEERVVEEKNRDHYGSTKFNPASAKRSFKNS